jgi:hypothetical protein
MNQIVKLQISSDLEDVSKISAITLDDAISNVSLLQVKVSQIKRDLYGLNLIDETHRKELKRLLTELNETNFLLSKIDMRVGDVASIIGGLISIFENKETEQKEEQKDDNISSG